MAENVGYATLTIIPSAKGFAKALGGETDSDFDRAGRDGGDKMGRGMLGALGPAAAAAAGLFAAGSVVGFFKGAVSEASDLNESLNAVSVTYGEASAGVMQLGRDAAASMGLSNVEFNGLAVRFSAFAKNIAGEGGDVTATLKDLTGRASDFASVMNLEVSDAAELFQSGLAGETEPLRKYGIDLSAAAVEAYAMANGIAASGAEMTEAQKVQARYGALMEQTAQTQGDFANTSDALANAQRIMGATWDNISAKIGAAFLPALGAGVAFLSSTVLPGVENFVDRVLAAVDLLQTGDITPEFFAAFGGAEDSPVIDFLLNVRDTFLDVKSILSTGFTEDESLLPNGVATGLQDIRTTVLEVMDALAPLGEVMGNAFGSLGPSLAEVLPLLSPFGLIFQALLPVLPQLANFLVGDVAGGVDRLGAVLAVIVPIVGQVVAALSGVFVAILPTVSAVIAALAGAFQTLGPVILTIVEAFAPLVSTLIGMLVPVVTQLITTVLPPVVAVFNLIVSAVAPLVEMLLGLLIPVIQALMPVVQVVFDVIVNVITAAMQIVQGIIEVVTGLISGNWDQVWAGLGNILAGVWNAIVAIVAGAINIVFSTIGAVLGLIGQAWDAFWKWVGDLISGAWNRIVLGATIGFAQLLGFFQRLPDQIFGFLGGLGNTLFTIGQDIIRGLLNGIRDMAGGIRDALLGPIEDAVGGVKDFLGIRSPSRVFFGIGAFTTEGMALGIWSNADMVRDAAEALIPPVPDVQVPTVRPGGVAGSFDAAYAARGGGAPQVTNNIELRDEDPRVVGRKFGREFARAMTGAAI